METPEAVNRLGDEVFIKCPVYQCNQPVKVLYINQCLFATYCAEGASHNWQEMSDFIRVYFNLTLDITQSNAHQIGWAYVDKQADPLNLSLSGNLGSGRAYYVGRWFNIKGEKTPLATSQEAFFADGILTLDVGIWNCLIANTLYESMDCHLSPVLALLEYTTIDKEITQKRSKVIRLDINGALDRVSHLFYKQEPLTKKQLVDIAPSLGKLDAAKVIQRVLHGSWSNGNTSPRGFLIDYDTVCAVKGRNPQYSDSGAYLDNYFSYEYLGKMKVIESLVNDPLLNPSLFHNEEELKSTIISERNNTLYAQFPHLMGFFDLTIDTSLSSEIHRLCDQFIALCRYMRHDNPSDLIPPNYWFQLNT